MKKLLEVKSLKVYYDIRNSHGLHTSKQQLKAVDDVSFDVFEGETFGIVGESGCGKTTTGKAIVRLLHPNEGQILFDGKDLARKMRRRERKQTTRDVQMIIQDPYSSLDPRFTVGRIIAEPLRVHKEGSWAEQKERVVKLMQDVGLVSEMFSKYPHEFSGGQRQRIGVARALALSPRLIVCDEPVSALDVSIQAQILNLLKDLQNKYGLTYVFISHDLSVVKHLCDRIAVMYLGHIVEMCTTKALFAHPLHPYTSALLSAIPLPDPESSSVPVPLEGDVPSAVHPPSGCCFRTRCPYADAECAKYKPVLQAVEEGHYAACLKINEIHHLESGDNKQAT